MHIAFTYNSSTVGKAFLNGTVGGTANSGTVIGAATANMCIGARTYGGFQGYFCGLIADVALWGVELTQLEITALALGALPKTIRPNSRLGDWPLDGLQSPEPDLSGHAFNGTLTTTSGTINPAFGPPVSPWTPRRPQEIFVAAAPPPTVIYRRSLSAVGTRVGSRQAVM
jgi:hypothetical protein